MDTEKQKILEKIRKLMAVGRNGAASEAEVETYMAKARELMDEYGVQESEVIDKSPQAAFDSMVCVEALKRSRLYKFELILAAAVCYICDTRAVTSADFNGHQTLKFYGLPIDVQLATSIFAELCIAARILCRDHIERHGSAKDRATGWSMRHHYFCDGFAVRISARARELKHGSTATPGLVLAKDALLKRYADEKFGPMGEGRAMKVDRNSPEFLAGVAKGNSYDLGRGNKLAPIGLNKGGV